MDLEDPWNEPKFDTLLKLGVSPEKAPDKPTYVEIDFEAGGPVAVDGVKMSPLKLVEKLNELGGANGVGIADITEDRLVGMKSRGVYETPGGTILYTAIEELEYLCLDRDTQAFKRMSQTQFSQLVYDGKWFTPLREAMSAISYRFKIIIYREFRLPYYLLRIYLCIAKQRTAVQRRKHRNTYRHCGYHRNSYCNHRNC